MWVGALRVTFRLRQARSLKDKRAVRARLFGRVAKLDLAGAEVADADRLDRLVLGFAVVAGERGVALERLDRARRALEDNFVAELVDRRVEAFKLSEEPGGWIPPDLLPCQDD